jgi:preprotein translocase subunit SecG
MLASLLLAFSWYGFIKGLMMVFFMITAFLLMLVVLIQEPKGGGLSSAFGGVGAETFGVQTGGVNKFTAWVAGIWMGLAVVYAAWPPPDAGASSLLDQAPAVERPADEGDGEPGIGVPPGEGESEGGGESGGESEDAGDGG